MNPPDRRTSTHTSDTRFLRHVLACALAQYRRESRGHPRPRVTCATFPAFLIFTRKNLGTLPIFLSSRCSFSWSAALLRLQYAAGELFQSF